MFSPVAVIYERHKRVCIFSLSLKSEGHFLSSHLNTNAWYDRIYSSFNRFPVVCVLSFINI